MTINEISDCIKREVKLGNISDDTLREVYRLCYLICNDDLHPERADDIFDKIADDEKTKEVAGWLDVLLSSKTGIEG